MVLKINGDNVHETLTERSRRRREGLRDTQAAEMSRPPRNDIRPKLDLVERPIDALRPPPQAVRKGLPAQVERIKRSYGAFGFVEPLLIRGDGEIIAGVNRLEAARQLGLGALPCIVVDHLSEKEIRSLRISLNRLGETGTWDFEALRIELDELIVLDAPLEATGFTLPEIDALLIDDAPAADQGESALEPDVAAPPVSRVGDVWRLGKHVIACGDAREPALYKELMKSEAARLVLTDEPFNVHIGGHVTSGDHAEFAMASGEMSRDEFEAFNGDWMKACLAHLTPGGLLATFIDWRSIELVLGVGRGLGLDLLNLIVWTKTNGGMGALWRSQHELLPVFKKPGAPHLNNVELGKHGRWRSNVWQYPGASSLGSDARNGLAGHPTVKPVALLEDALLDVTHPGDVVLEPFAGSGSTLIACETTGRRCRAIELDPRYVDLVVRRWEALTGHIAMHVETGAGFEEMAATRQKAAALLVASDASVDR
ncbi:MAG: DNA methylase [Phenylobacterium sp.]|nr:MAG: DNA methylase [Phenylobacterium sp.]